MAAAWVVVLMTAMMAADVMAIMVTDDQWYLVPEQYQSLLHHDLDVPQHQYVGRQQPQLTDRQYQVADIVNRTEGFPERKARQAVMLGGGAEGFPRMPFMRMPSPPQFPRGRQVRHPFGIGSGRFPGLQGVFPGAKPPPSPFSAPPAGVVPRPVRSNGLQLGPAGVPRQPYAYPGKALLSPAQLGKISQFLQLNIKPLHLPDVEGAPGHRFPGAGPPREPFPAKGANGLPGQWGANGVQGFLQPGKDQAVSYQNFGPPPAKAPWVTQPQPSTSEQPSSADTTYQTPQWAQQESPSSSLAAALQAEAAKPVRFSEQDSEVATQQQTLEGYRPGVVDAEGSSSHPAIKLIDPPALGPPHHIEQLRQQQQLQEQLEQQQLEQQQQQQRQLEQQQQQRQLEQQQQQRQLETQQQQQLQQQEQVEEQQQQQQQSEVQQVEEFVPPVPRKRATLKGILNQDCPTAEDDGYCASPPRYPSQQITAAVKQCEGLLAAMYAPLPEQDDDDDLGEATESADVTSNSTRDMVRGNRQVWSWARYNSTTGVAQSNTACASERRRVEPGYAREASTGRWFVVVQAGATLRQKVPVDVCSAPGKACAGLLGGKCSPRGGFRSPAKTSRCVQRHSYQHLVAWDPDSPEDCPRLRVFRFPSACVCQLGVV